MVYAVLMTLYQVKAGTAGDNCTWCSPPHLTCGSITDSDGWRLVRAVGSSRKAWFPNHDHLQGTDAYSDNGDNIYNIGNFNQFVPGYNQFLFVTYVLMVLFISQNVLILKNYYYFKTKYFL